MSFESDIAKFSKDVIAGSEKVIRGTFIDAGSKVIRRTPVDTGRARGNWFTELNGVSDASTEKTREGAKRMREIRGATLSFKIGQSMSIVNNLPYIIPLEDGHSTQAPSGMVKIVFANLERTLLNYVRRLT